jgi:hypothetical protein
MRTRGYGKLVMVYPVQPDSEATTLVTMSDVPRYGELQCPSDGTASFAANVEDGSARPVDSRSVEDLDTKHQNPEVPVPWEPIHQRGWSTVKFPVHVISSSRELASTTQKCRIEGVSRHMRDERMDHRSSDEMTANPSDPYSRGMVRRRCTSGQSRDAATGLVTT